jgi:hypothetical protein
MMEGKKYKYGVGRMRGAFADHLRLREVFTTPEAAEHLSDNRMMLLSFDPIE